ncbi:MAG: DUF3857 domain-containing protein, partial [Leadbetterella sp.]
MKKIIILFIILGLKANAQQKKYILGGFTLEQYKSIPESESPAIIVEDEAKITYIKERKVQKQVYTYHGIKKILKKSAISSSNVNIICSRYGGWITECKNIKAYTYNLIGNKLVKEEMPADNINVEFTSDDYFTYKINLLNVREGSIIEYSYQRLKPVQANFAISTWTFNDEFPVMHSSISLEIPDFLKFKTIIKGKEKLSYVNEEYKALTFEERVYRNSYFGKFEASNLPARKVEPYATSKDKDIVNVRFYLSKYTNNWGKEIDFSTPKEFLKNYLDFTEFKTSQRFKKDYFDNTIQNLAKDNSKSKLDKIKLISREIQKTIEFNGRYGINVGDLDRLYKDKTGNAAQINGMLYYCLNKLGIESQIVLTNTLDIQSPDTTMIDVNDFNYLIVRTKTDEGYKLYDISEKHLEFGLLPDRIKNTKGLIIQKDIVKFIDVKNNPLYHSESKIILDISKEETVTGNFLASYKAHSSNIKKSKIVEKGIDNF